MKKEFKRNIISVDVNGSRQINTYIVKGLYDVIHDDGYVTSEYKEIANIKYDWSDIENVSDVFNKIKKEYNAVTFSEYLSE